MHGAQMNLFSEDPPMKNKVETAKYGLRQAPPSARPGECGSLDPLAKIEKFVFVSYYLHSAIKQKLVQPQRTMTYQNKRQII